MKLVTVGLSVPAAREGRLLALLGAAMTSAGQHPSKEEQFDIWMKNESDLVQASLATEAFSSAIQK